jgi:molybdopterin-guanine dinucleotide biosynthesis protein A
MSVRRQPVGVILAGGGARRLGGVAKGLLEIGGERIIDRVAKALRPITSRLVIVSNAAAASEWLAGADALMDERPGAGALPGVATAIRAVQQDVLVVAWDMPFVTCAVLDPLLRDGDGYDASMWNSASGVEPLCGYYAVSALPAIDAAIADGVRAAREIASLLRVRLLQHVSATDEPTPFLSINTPADFALARRLAAIAPSSLAPQT